MRKCAKKECTVYYGAAITDRVKLERMLPLVNPATTKRMSRIAEALQTVGKRCFILSPAIMPKSSLGFRIVPSMQGRIGRVPFVALKQFGLRYIGYLLTPLTAILAACGIARKRQINVVAQYCYYPDAVVFSLWCKLMYGSKVILDLEDICQPRLSDWKRGSETRPVLQIYGSWLMKFSIWLADMVIIPSKKFANFVPLNKCCVITGCQKVVIGSGQLKQNKTPTLLFSGGITEENGINVLMDALRIVDDFPREFVVKICGAGVKREWAEQQVKSFRNIDVKVLGFLDNDTFETLYSNVDICFALQNPNGRHGFFKTPSKGYEALCSGKALIVSDIGDFHELPDDVCFHVRPYTAEKLAEILSNLTQEDVLRKRENALEYSKAHFDVEVVGKMIWSRFDELQRA